MNKLDALAAAARDNAPDALMVAGAAGVAYGAWLIHPAMGWIAGGLFSLVAGLAWAGSRK